jgi:hypothetical protein
MNPTTWFDLGRLIITYSLLILIGITAYRFFRTHQVRSGPRRGSFRYQKGKNLHLNYTMAILTAFFVGFITLNFFAFTPGKQVADQPFTPPKKVVVTAPPKVSKAVKEEIRHLAIQARPGAEVERAEADRVIREILKGEKK